MKKILLGLAAVAVLAYACSKTNNDKITNPADPAKTTQGTMHSRTLPTPSEMDGYLAKHNAFMSALIDGQIASPETQTELIESLKPYVDFVSSSDFTDEMFNGQLLAQAQRYGSLEGSANVQQLKTDMYVTSAEGVVLNEIILKMDGADYDNLNNFLGKLGEYSLSQNYTALPDSSKQLINLFVKTYRNSAILYHPYTENILEKAVVSNACKKCLKDNIRKILLADGVGTLVGVAGCLICWPCCGVVLPAAIAFGSGNAVWFYCRGKC